MKNINISSKMRERILTGGLSLVLLTGGFTLGRASSNSNTNETNVNVKSQDEIAREYLDEYIEQRSSLENEIDILIKQKEELQNELSSQKEKTNKTFYLSDLIVIKPTERNNLSDVYILDNYAGDTYKEYHNYFKAVACKDNNNYETWYNGQEYVFFWEYENLFNYLTNEELATVAANDGRITTLELDKIEKRLRNDYQEEKTESNQLTK